MTASQHLIEEIERALLKCARDRVQGRHHLARRLWRHTSCGEDDESGGRFLSPVMGFPLAPRLIFLSPHRIGLATQLVGGDRLAGPPRRPAGLPLAANRSLAADATVIPIVGDRLGSSDEGTVDVLHEDSC